MQEISNQISGTFEPDERGGGFLRDPARNYEAGARDPFVPDPIVKKFRLRGGEAIRGSTSCDGKRTQRDHPIAAITEINETPVDAWGDLAPFEQLTVIDPRRRLRFETKGGPMTMRVIDLMTPIGFGQRALIVAPPRTGKTILLQQMAHAVAENHLDAYIMVLLIDERPEEVTEMRRSIRGEVVHSSNDQSVASHVRIARLVIAGAKRRVEQGQHVVILLDSLTRLGRAFNAHIRDSGRIMSGGLDIRALEEPKAVFGAARNIENGGSLTIIASALIETGSRMDDVIFNEFKGTGNMEIVLSRALANKRIWPAIDLQQSGTRKEELLLTKPELEKSYAVRRQLIDRPPEMAMETLLEWLGKFPNNDAFVADAGRQFGFRDRPGR